MKGNKLYSTELLQEHISYCDNLEDFSKEILSMSQELRVLWKEKITSIMQESGYTLAALAKLCGVSHVAVKKWCDGALPQSRELFIRIGFAANYSLEEMNRFLMRYGNYPALYAKSLEDSVYIFVLSSNKMPHTYAMCERILEQLRLSGILRIYQGFRRREQHGYRQREAIQPACLCGIARLVFFPAKVCVCHI